VTITDSRPARSRPPLGLGSSLTAAYYGLGLAGLIVAEVGLVLVLLGWVLLGALSIASVPVGPGDGQKRELFLLLFLGIGVAIARFLVPPVLLALRRLAGLTRRLAEAERMGFRRAVVPAGSAGLEGTRDASELIEVVQVEDIRQALAAVLGT